MFGRRRNIVCLLIGLMAGLCGCSSRTFDEAQAVVAQADSLWHIGQIYGIDEGDSATLAQAYETLKKQSAASRQLSEVFPFVPCTSSLCTYAHACYHYGRLLRQKDDPVSAMQVFINATHSHTRDYHILGRVYSNMGSICHLANEFPLSYDMYERSADCFLKNGDTLLYYYGLNNMTFELALQKDTINVKILLDKIRLYPDSALRIKTWETEAVLYQTVNNYEVVVELIDSLQAYGYTNAVCYMMKARAFNYLCQYDSALWYAQEVVSLAPDDNAAIAAYYILSHDDQTLDTDSILNLTSARADVQKAWAYSQSKFAQAVQLLEQDLTREPDWKWLIFIVATIFVISLCLLLYIFRKRRQHKLLSQQVNDLATANAAVKQRHEQLVQDYTIYKQSIVEQIEQNCIILLQADDFPRNIHWKDYNAMCEIINDDFGQLTTKLQTIYHLSEREIRLCVLVLLGISNSEQLAEILHYGSSGIRNFKNRTAKKLGTNSIKLRKILLNIAVGELQETGE